MRQDARVAKTDQPEPDQGTTRLGGFSDGYFAIVITLLAIELRPPELPAEVAGWLLWQEVVDLWPNFVAFTITFANLLILWVIHHELIRIVTKVGTPFLYLNGGLLFGVALMPFATALVAEHIMGPGARLAAAFYCATFLWVALFFNLIWRQVSQPVRGNLVDTVGRGDRRRIGRTYLFTLALYALAFGLAFLAPLAAVGVTAALGIFFAVADRVSGFASEDLARDE